MHMDDKHFEHLAKMQSLESMDHWYSWDSPIGLMLFFIGLVVCAILIKFFFLMK